MKYTHVIALMLVCGIGIAVAADILPFGVKVGGQSAKAENALFATVAKPVAPDAEMEVDAKGPMIIVNVFPCDKKGTVKKGAQPEIILLQKTNKIKLSSTMSKKKLVPGEYIMNIVAEGKTSRVKFTVHPPAKAKKEGKKKEATKKEGEKKKTS
jgi:hypothetical protein